MSPITMKVVVRPGVDRRVNVVLAPMGMEPMPVMEALPEAPQSKLATTPPPSMEDMLSGAMKQVSGNGALAMNGVG